MSDSEPSIIDHSAFLKKAKIYIEQMESHGQDEWQYSMLSSLVLEFIARGSLAFISPLLVVDPKNWHNLFYALGHDPVVPKFTLSSIPMNEVLDRLGAIHTSVFNKELVAFSRDHSGRRNSELHTADLAFHGIDSASWISKYFKACQALLHTMNMTLENLFNSESCALAAKVIAAEDDETAKVIKKLVNANQTVWEAKTKEDRAVLSAQAEAWASSKAGHRVECPSCKSQSLLFGEPTGAPKTTIDDDWIIQKQQYLPTHFECIACSLKIHGLSKLNVCALGGVFSSTEEFDKSEYYESEGYQYVDYEPDYNEPF